MRYAAGLAIAAFAVAIGAQAEEPAAKAGKTPAFDAMKKLVGDWSQADEHGKPTGPVVSSMKLIANGSVLHETLFPGTAHEMVSVYHMDGQGMICTHYCALGNQPRLRMVAGKDPKVLEFKSVAVGNGKSMNDAHMGHAVITLVDGDHFIAEWQSLKDQKPDPAHKVKLSLARKPK